MTSIAAILALAAAAVTAADGGSAPDGPGGSVFPQPATAYDLRKLRCAPPGRAVYAVRVDERDVIVGWRYRSYDPTNAAFNVYANGVKLNDAPIRDVTYFRTPWTGKKTVYEVRRVSAGAQSMKGAAKKPAAAKNGTVKKRAAPSWTLPANAPVGYFDIELSPPPPSELPDGKTVAHHPCDCSVGDLDGDGKDELVVIWWPDNAADNSSWHVTGETWLDGVKLDGTNRSLWKVNLGRNIRSGSHYTPVMVADFDGDGCAEVVCRTADGTVDGKGRVIGDAAADFREPNGHVLWARNFVTVFDGRTGAALDSIPFKPDVLEDPVQRAARNEKAINREWSSRNPGNQAFRFLAAVAYLDGAHPSVVMCRGYYSRTCLWALDWDGKKLSERWFFDSNDPRWKGYGGQGFHNLRVADVDFDGKDEIVYGHMTVDHDGSGLYTTGMGHGDAMHVIQSAPDVRGLQVWTCHEAPPFGVSLFDARTGAVSFWKHGGVDTGSCNAMDIDATMPGVELFSGANCGIYSAKTGKQYMHPKPNPRINYYSTLRFGIWWLGDMTRSAYSGGSVIRGYSVKGRKVYDIANLGGGVESNHGSKGCPCLIADIFGDWREEILLRRADNRAIRVFMSPEPTKWRFHTFMEDPVYRISVLTQNNGYNLPTGTGFYFGPDLLGHDILFRGTRLP
jgi:rhamnogalacturonan endolyase